MKHAERIFRHFSQFRRAGGEGSGVGMGLASCKRLVELHGGGITVASSPGARTCFSMIFSGSIELSREAAA